MENDDSIRCGACHRKLAEGQYLRLSIKCPRCGTINHLRATRPTPERHRASNPRRTSDEDLPHSPA
ncbi:Com family DNA-binding transcriptional regulator [Comamonas sp. NLF-1-9]|uniref:Com family DNA-binding transcriptional regulator n=1 Tax=Comamonas sp. NLF-1-9 TaxID=2853163 RepID=UPI001C48D319|nr:Com family DNA-binding transcriptional regulator [Comamonas sp. NLF-1-9]QXL84084.1 Com family DNA-binding transcriptional regulator [Comamonas sp. NLF-1-9]